MLIISANQNRHMDNQIANKKLSINKYNIDASQTAYSLTHFHINNTKQKMGNPNIVNNRNRLISRM